MKIIMRYQTWVRMLQVSMNEVVFKVEIVVILGSSSVIEAQQHDTFRNQFVSFLWIIFHFFTTLYVKSYVFQCFLPPFRGKISWVKELYHGIMQLFDVVVCANGTEVFNQLAQSFVFFISNLHKQSSEIGACSVNMAFNLLSQYHL